MNIFRTLGLATAASALLATAACSPDGASLPPLSSTATIDDSYVLDAGDKLQITLIEAVPSADRTSASANGADQFVVSENGDIEAPFIGSVPARGKTVDELKAEIVAKLSQGYVKDPKVSVSMVTYRPFFIVGEVNHPGSYPCSARSRTLSAVALAGGYTYRANEEFAIVERRKGDTIITGRVGPNTPILPDDVIRVTQRYF